MDLCPVAKDLPKPILCVQWLLWSGSDVYISALFIVVDCGMRNEGQTKHLTVSTLRNALVPQAEEPRLP